MPTLNDQDLLHYTEYGSGDNVVLLLHGLGSRGIDWQPQIDALKQNYRVVTVDFPGHGKSSPARTRLSMKILAAEVKQVVDQLGLKRIHVVGLSLGGMVAFQMAVDFPHLLRSLVIINSAPGPGERIAKFKRQLLMRKLLLRCFGLGVLAKKIATNLFPQPSQQLLRDQFMDSIEAVDIPSYRKTVDAIGNFNIREDIKGCQIPTLILAADQDYTSVAFKQDYARDLKNALVCVIPHSRHASPLDSPEFCNRKISEFLTEV